MFTRSLQAATLSRRALCTGLIITLSLSALPAYGGSDHHGAGSHDTGLVMAITNAPGGNAVVVYRRAADGSLTAATGGNPTDVAMSEDGRYLYARVAATSTIAVFRIARDGSLAALPSLTGTPAGLAGLAGF